MSRVRVLYLSHALSVGGAEDMVLNLIRYLPDRFARSMMCIHEAGPLGAEVKAANVPLRVLGLTPGLARPFDLLRLRDALFEHDPHIVHTFLLSASLYGRLAAMLARVPVVIGSEVNIYQRKAPLHILAERWLMRGTDAVVASAAAVRDFYLDQIGGDRSKVEVIYNAVDWSRLEPTMSRDEFRASCGVPAGAMLAGIVGRLTEQKAHRVLFEALARHSSLSDLHLVVVGDGELREELRRRSESLGLASRVHFTGIRRDVGNVLAAIDLFVMPSLWEGLPLALVDAMGAGLPVVASAVAGIPEVVKHGETGLLVNPGDVDGLAAALARLCGNEKERRRLGEAARAFVRPRFGVDGFVSATTALYDRLLAEKGLAPALSGVEA